MKTITAAELLTTWQAGQVTTETALNALIQNLARQETAITALNVSWAKLRGDVDRLTAHTGLSPEGRASDQTQ
jgi:hypothetical protein